MANIASIPPDGNPIARPASLGFELPDGEEVAAVPEVGEPAPAEALELAEDAADDAAAVEPLDLSVAVAVFAVAVAVASADTGAVM